MGKFIYEGSVKTEIEDRALTHLQLVMTAKLRRAEPFPFSWREDASVGGGRTTVWVQPGSSLVFKYFGSRQPSINRAWIEALAFTANAPSGYMKIPIRHTRQNTAAISSAPIPSTSALSTGQIS